jgi:hypothetical protein
MEKISAAMSMSVAATLLDFGFTAVETCTFEKDEGTIVVSSYLCMYVLYYYYNYCIVFFEAIIVKLDHFCNDILIIITHFATLQTPVIPLMHVWLLLIFYH